MKYIIFFVALLSVYPAGLMLRGKTRAISWLVLLCAFLPLMGLEKFSINFVSMEQYRGDARGFEVVFLDLIYLTLAVALPPRAYAPPYQLQRMLYLFAALLSVGSSEIPLYSAFGVWKLLRMYLAIRVLSRACEDPALSLSIVKGLAIGASYQLLLCIQQRYLFGFYRAQGCFHHPNTLGMALNLITPMMFALLLSGRGGRLASLTVGATALCLVMSLSRGAMAMFVMSCGFVYVVSLSRRFTGRKLFVAFLAVLGLCVILAKSYDTLVDRFVNAPKESEESRIHFEEAAAAMLEEHPAGVGMNLFSHMLETQYAPRFEIAQVDQSGLVHNIYWLTAAEMGYLGFFSYIIYIASPLLLALFYGRFAGTSLFGDLSLGAAVGLGVFFVQGTLEWASRQTALSYLIASVFCLIPSFARELRRSSSSRSSHLETL